VRDAYLESYLVVSYMISIYTQRHIRLLLDRIAEDVSPEDAVVEVFHRDYEELLEEVLEDYRSEIASR